MESEIEMTAAARSLIGVAVCSKDQLFGEALASLLQHEGGFNTPVRETKFGNTLAAARNHDIAVVVLDSSGLTADEAELLPGVRALGAYKLLALAPKPDANLNVDQVVDRNTSAARIFSAVRQLGQQATGIVRERRTSYNNPLHLTKREYDVAQLISRGFSNRRISQQLELREQSVKNLVSVIMRKLNCENRTQVALLIAPGMPRPATD